MGLLKSSLNHLFVDLKAVLLESPCAFSTCHLSERRNSNDSPGPKLIEL